MSGPSVVRLDSRLEGPEGAALAMAADRLALALGEAAGAPVAVNLQAGPGAEPAFVIASLSAAVEDARPWPDVERDLRGRFAGLVETAPGPVFVCTVLRRPHEDSECRRAILVRIRRLNLLAADLSRELGLFVIDIDRDLADVGARSLQTDWRLGGPYAAEAAARCMARALVAAGLDAIVSPEIEAQAAETLAAWRPSVAISSAQGFQLAQPSLVARRRGGRREIIAVDAYPVQESRTTWLVQGLLARRIQLAPAAAALLRSLASRQGRTGLGRLAGRVGRTLAHARARL